MNKSSSPNSNRKETLKYFSLIILLTLSFNLFSANVSYFPLTSLRFFGFILLFIALLAFFPFKALDRIVSSKVRKDKESRDNAVAVLLMMVAFVILFGSSQRIYWMLSFCIFIFGLNSISRMKMEKETSLIMAGTLLYTAFFLLTMYNPYVYKSVSSLSFAFTHLVGKAFRVPLELGPSPSGFWIWFYFAMSILAVFLYDIKGGEKVKRVKQVLLSLCGSVCLWIVALLCYGYVFSSLKAEALVPITLLQVILFFMLVSLFFVSVRKVEFTSQPVKIQLKPWRKTATLILLFVSAVFLTTLPYLSEGKPGKVVFYQRDCAMGSYLPEFPKEGESFQGDMGITVGATLWYFEERGYTIEILDDTNTTSVKDALQDAAVFIIANPKNPLPYEDCQSIHAFVKNGGGLLVLGEHTNMMVNAVDFQRGHHPLNDVLEPTGIRVLTDTAEWTHAHWQSSQEFLPHTVVRGLNPAKVRTGSVGASLSLTGSAFPIIVGRYAFSDDPNPLEPGYLGNREFDSGEHMGDIVLAAGDTYGEGRVLVFGDTSYGFNEALPSTWKLMENSITFLTSENKPQYLNWAAFIFFTGTLILWALVGAGKEIMGATILFIAVLIAALFIASAVSVSVDVPQMKTDSVAWIDASHLNRVNLSGYQENSIDGLTKNLLRNHYLPLFMDDTAQLKEGRILIIIAPTRGYSSREVKDIRTFVENGGFLLMSVGAGEKDGAQSLLRTFEMDIADVPLGPVPWIIETHGTTPQIAPEDLEKYWHEPKFMEVYPVGCSNPLKSYASLTYLGKTYDLIISKQYGKGMVVLIGDSRFLLDENLEYSLSSTQLNKPQFAAIWVGNVELLRDLFTDFNKEEIS